jgi:hypothetical protein
MLTVWVWGLIILVTIALCIMSRNLITTIIGVEINGSEYAYGGNSLLDCTGVYEMYPKNHDVFKYKFTIEVGVVKDEEAV